jgi:multicomponent Na+:H+ antiporter subunit D
MFETVLPFLMTPVAPLFIGAILLLFLPNILRVLVTIAAPAVALYLTWNAQTGLPISIAGLELELMRVDKLSTLFSTLFSIAAILVAIYAAQVRDRVQQIATMLYAGAAIGAVLAGDLVALFVYWEITALSSVFLIWANRTNAAFSAGMRYLFVQVGSGIVLVAGIAMHYQASGSIAFENLTGAGPETWSTGIWLIFVALGVKAAFPLLHAWLPDAYPAATITGTVALSAFTTKMAIYALARGFPGTDLLIVIGVVMALFPIIFALLENDLRRVLAHALNSQLGFMVVGIGIGTQIALNGAVAHAFASVLYQGLLFMTAGAVIHRTGTGKANELGGLARSMPLTFAFCIIGAASIASVPLTAGFSTKSMTIEGAAYAGQYWAWFALYVASMATIAHTSLKVPYSMFLKSGPKRDVKDAPPAMLLAMGLAAAACLYIGTAPGALYAMLPFPVHYEPYTTAHVLAYGQIILFAVLAFMLLLRAGLLPTMKRETLINFDWTYRKFAPAIFSFIGALVSTIWSEIARGFHATTSGAGRALAAIYGPNSVAARVLPTGMMVLWLAVLFAVVLALNLLDVR